MGKRRQFSQRRPTPYTLEEAPPDDRSASVAKSQASGGSTASRTVQKKRRKSSKRRFTPYTLVDVTLDRGPHIRCDGNEQASKSKQREVSKVSKASKEKSQKQSLGSNETDRDLDLADFDLADEPWTGL